MIGLARDEFVIEALNGMSRKRHNEALKMSFVAGDGAGRILNPHELKEEKERAAANRSRLGLSVMACSEDGSIVIDLKVRRELDGQFRRGNGFMLKGPKTEDYERRVAVVRTHWFMPVLLTAAGQPPALLSYNLYRFTDLEAAGRVSQKAPPSNPTAIMLNLHGHDWVPNKPVTGGRGRGLLAGTHPDAVQAILTAIRETHN
jgi:hypothetical protein